VNVTKVSNGALCERARSWAALAPDGELSELEHKLLDSHLTRCAACSCFAVEVAAVAAELRSSDLELLPRPVSIPTWHRRPVYARFRGVAAAAAVAGMALGIASRAPIATSDGDSLPRVVDFSGGDAAEQERLLVTRSYTISTQRAMRNRPARFVDNRPA
jgi:predicted anti-sigma-YlaC factor YlaD